VHSIARKYRAIGRVGDCGGGAISVVVRNATLPEGNHNAMTSDDYFHLKTKFCCFFRNRYEPSQEDERLTRRQWSFAVFVGGVTKYQSFEDVF
jgi:hypothetical protein